MEEIDGVYAFCLKQGNILHLARDIIGIKPLWYHWSDYFCFASERKALKEERLDELNPRSILTYNIKTNKLSFIKRLFFDITPEIKEPKQEIVKQLTGLITNAVAKRIPDQKFGILFSGGIDSTLIAFICKKLGVPFICYTAALEEKGMGKADDLVHAEIIAKELGFSLKVNKLNIKQTENLIKKVCPLIEETNVVKVGVALTFYAACELAKKDKIKVIFSGLGSEELFAGYQRHKNSTNINKECVSGLLKMYERDTYRDDVITMNNSLELRLPFLDKTLAKYSLRIPAKYKLTKDAQKVILRDAAIQMGLNKEFALRKKKAAQYGSKFDRAILKLSKKQSKSDYLRQFFKPHKMNLAVLFSSGKDSCYAMHVMQRQNYNINCLITIKSKNQESFMYHTPNIHLAELQAKAMELPIIIQETDGVKEHELNDLKKALTKAKKEHKIDGIITGALFSTYQRDRIEKIADQLNLKIFSPLWHIDQELEMRRLLIEDFEFILSSIAADGLTKEWLGKNITNNDIDQLVKLKNKLGLNVAGEGGEFESLVLDAPMFKKKIIIKKSSKFMDSEHSGRFVVKDAILIKK